MDRGQPTEPTPEQVRRAAMRRTSVVGAIINLALTLLKVGVGLLGNSAALVADGVHSLSDLATDVMVWFAARYGNEPPDRDHPYGHGRIETLFTVALGGVLLLTAIGILVDAGKRLLDPAHLSEPTALVLVIAALSIVSKELLYRWTMSYARRHRSRLLEANAWHHRSDAVSSIVVLVGVAGSMAGFHSLDAFAAAGVALMIAQIGWGLARGAVRELIDTGLEPERLREIRVLIGEVEGVRELLLLRTRRSAGQILLDAHLKVSPQLSVSEGHQIGMYVRDLLLESDYGIIDVTIHIDPEDDESENLSRGLPLRREVLARLREVWRDELPSDGFRQVTLHYLEGRIDIDLVLPRDPRNCPDPQVLAERLRRAGAAVTWLRTVRVLYGAEE